MAAPRIMLPPTRMSAAKKGEARRKPGGGEPTEKVRARYDKFIEAYFETNLNGTQAAIKSGYSEKTAGAIASGLLKVPYIARRVEARARELAKKFELRSEDTLRRLKGLRDVSVKEMFNPDGSAKAPHDLDDEVARCIDGIKMTETSFMVGKVRHTERVYEYKVTRKGGAVDMAMRHHGLYAKDNEQRAGAEELARQVRERLAEMESATGGKGEAMSEKPSITKEALGT